MSRISRKRVLLRHLSLSGRSQAYHLACSVREDNLLGWHKTPCQDRDPSRVTDTIGKPVQRLGEHVGECEEAEGIAAPDDDRSHGPVNSSRGSISLA
ncbi:hypothetical protein A6X20_16350 [Bradyrhizobium elkanii]|nr:hypothetical protein A6452_39415 [Bradyrhizobium elkanii]ODM82708.1 hypothetical protein A6X20_16350 [Bradyrhizobium elkanii]